MFHMVIVSECFREQIGWIVSSAKPGDGDLLGLNVVLDEEVASFDVSAALRDEF